jgi:hypothetical protein
MFPYLWAISGCEHSFHRRDPNVRVVPATYAVRQIRSHDSLVAGGGQAECLEFGRSLDRQIAGFCVTKDTRSGLDCKTAPAVRRVRGQPIKGTVFFAKIIKIWPHIHRRAGCALDEIVRHELAAVPVKVIA